MTTTQSLLGPLVVGLVLTLGLSSLLAAPGEAQPTVTNTLEGLVGDDMGYPLADANVEAKNASGSQSATTDARGNFEIEGLAPGQYTVTASKNGYLSQTRTVTLLAGQTQFIEFDLELTGAKVVSGVVTNADDGKPIEGAFVRANSYPDDGQYRFSENTTGADGTYAVKVWGGRAYVEATREKFYSAYQELELTANATLDFELRPIPRQTVKLVGDVKDDAGNPIQAMVNLRPDWEKGAGGGGSGCGPNETCIMPAGGGECPPDADCAASTMYYDPGPQNYNSTVTDENGHFEMMAYPGFVVVEANRRDYMVDTIALELKEGDSENVAFSLERAPDRTVTFRGKVVDAETGDPLPGASVSLNNPEWADWNWFQTKEDGTFEFQSRHGYTLLRAEAYRYYYVEVQCIEEEPEGNSSTVDGEAKIRAPCEPGQSGERDRDYFPHLASFRTREGQDVELTIKLTPKPGFDAEIVGYVVDADTNEAIPGAQVSVSNQETWEWGSATTDEDGSYRIEVRSGFHVVSAYANGHFENSTTTVISKGETARLDLFLVEGESRQMGWWDPDGYGGCRYDSPCPVYATSEDAAMSKSSGGGVTAGAPGSEGAMMGSSDADGRASFAADQSGGNSYIGSGGGLGPYRPASDGDERGAPGAGALLTVLGLVGALAVVARRKRN